MQGQITKWGNSLAVRIPKGIAEAAHLREGDTLEISVEDEGKVEMKAVHRKPTLKQLCDAITPENLHSEVDWGEPVGNEAW